MSRTERIVLGVLALLLVLSFLMLLRVFYSEHTVLAPERGGTYIEGSVGEVLPMNPWFVTGNDITRDINSLLFAGLMKYDPASRRIVDDLATVKVTDQNRTYTATLKPNLLWHDSTLEKPHPVTADDVVFTFGTLQQQGFPNVILQQNFRGVTIEKLDERTVRFRLQKPYAFFSSNLTLGLLPAASFQGIEASRLQDALDFGFAPVGAGPYRFVSLLQTDLSTEVTLRRFERTAMSEFHLERVVFRVFPDFSSLLTDVSNLSAIRGVPRGKEGQPQLPKNFHPLPYTLPQYVGLFFNLDRPIPSDKKVRLGLQLATNKQEIVDAIHETQIIDTPLLEIDLGNWRYVFDTEAAKGAFFDSNWNQPEKVRLQRLLEQREANETGPLRSVQRIAYLGTGSILTLTGSLGNLQLPLRVNGIPAVTGSVLVDGVPHALSGSWSVRLPAGNGASGSLKIGLNVLRMTDKSGDIVDSAFLERFSSTAQFSAAAEEQRLVQEFLRAKSLPAGDPASITVADLTLENGFLRRKKEGDMPHTRVNDRGRPLALTLLTSSRPETYRAVAETLKRQWEAVGASVTLDIPESRKEFEEKLMKRQYDVVLFGQSLFDNLDSYPYWHSSQIQEQSDPGKLRIDAFNLSQYASFEADSMLARIREMSDSPARNRTLGGLNEILKRDIPAIVLYSPLHVFGVSEDVRGVELKNLSLHADRFATFAKWYVSMERQFTDGTGWLQFPLWLLRLGFRS